MESRLPMYQAFFGRAADLVLAPQGDDPAAPFVYRFPPIKVGILRRLFVQLHDVCVYVSDGMSLREMPVPPEERRTYPSRIELMACARAPLAEAEDGQDVLIRLLSALAAIPFGGEMFFGPLHTLDLEEPICPNSQMRGLIFSVKDNVDMPRLCSCTHRARLVVNVVPIHDAELRLARDGGPLKLIEEFEAARVPDLFDPFRASVV